MPNINIKIGKREYCLACEHGEEEKLRDLGKEVSDRLDLLHENLPNAPDNLVLAMFAITLQDEFNEFKKNGASASSNVVAANDDEVVLSKAEFEILKQRIAALAEKVKKA